VGYLGPANGVQNSQNNSARCHRDEGAVKTRAALLDSRKVKARRIGDRLHVGTYRVKLVWGRVGVVYGNGGPIRNGDWSLEGVTKIRILGAAVSSIPTGVHVQVHQVRKP